ncbi:hypothetical protein HMPREF3148_03640 [Corynebacterium sp. HMSC05D08]|nr:hypothetical protein HMPREF0308_0731 [Corynebacterium striatum ATCC 6940]OFT64472.1 hypothetical protein HMPREF3148_03640 [Corynebacterium sp. HMSC05D08]
MGSSSNIEARGLEWEAFTQQIQEWTNKQLAERDEDIAQLRVEVSLLRDKLEVWRSRYFIVVHYIRQWRLRYQESVDELPIADELEQVFGVKQSLQRSRRSLKGLLCRFMGDWGRGSRAWSCAIGLPHWRPIVVCGHRSGRWVAGCALGRRRWSRSMVLFRSVRRILLLARALARCRGR